MDKCLIVKHQLGGKVWFLVEQAGKTLSTPIDTQQAAIQWIKTITGCRIGLTALSSDLTEVTLQGGVS